MSRKEISALLERHGIIPTPQRLEIAMIMLAEMQHLSADQVLARAKDEGYAVSKATVYNTLGLFAEKGLIRQVIVDPAKVFYDSNTGEHYHFYNVDTGKLIDLPAEQMAISDLPTVPAGTIAEGVDVIVRIRNK